jgi:dimethylglycine dehydrogenase
VREAVGLLDISGFSRFEVTGPGAKAWLDRIMASKLPEARAARGWRRCWAMKGGSRAT